MDLTSEQQAIVTTDHRIVLVIAGPGTGKTRVLTNRIACLVQDKQVDPSAILALTFTQKAAAEMRERLALMHKGPMPPITTFHGFCLDQLAKVGEVPILISEYERHDIISNLKKSLKEKRSVRELSLYITQAKSLLITAPDPILIQYHKMLASQKFWDFDDILLNFYQKLIDDPKVQAQVQKEFQYIFVDEFQDTNDIQYQILKQLVSDHQHLFVIGDPLQSIYAFRGANPKIFRQLQTDYPESQTFTLSTNFRADQNLIATSNRLFPEQVNLQAASQLPGLACHLTTYDSFSEANWIVATIGKHIGGSDLLKADHTERPARFSDFAVIYRSHNQSIHIEKRLQDSGLPYQRIGGNSLYEQPNIAFVIAVLRYLNKPSEKLKQELTRTKMIRTNPNLIHAIPELGSPVTTAVASIAQAFNLDQTNSEFQQFVSTLVRFDTVQTGLADFLSYYDYLTAHEFYDVSADKITLLTMHAAKGLEFPIVFLPYFDDTPGVSQQTKNDEEEQRLLYVALTRAEHELYLISAQYRNKQKTKPSPFQALIQGPTLESITDEAIKKIMKRKELWRRKNAQISLF